MKMYVREFLQPRGIFVAVANNITSYQLCCSRANKIFFIFFSHGAARIFSKKREDIFSLRRVVVVVFGRKQKIIRNISFFMVDDDMCLR